MKTDYFPVLCKCGYQAVAFTWIDDRPNLKPRAAGVTLTCVHCPRKVERHVSIGPYPTTYLWLLYDLN